MKLIQLQNPWGGKWAYCERHIDAHRPDVLSAQYPHTETVIDGDCADCTRERRHAEAPAAMRAALMAPDHSHTRFRYHGVHAYRYDRTSPSGVMLVASLDEPRFDALLAAMRAEGIPIRGGMSPLSPTEAR